MCVCVCKSIVPYSILGILLSSYVKSLIGEIETIPRTSAFRYVAFPMAEFKKIKKFETDIFIKLKKPKISEKKE